MNIFDVIGYILRVKHKKVTKISILATQVYNIYSLGGGKLYVYPNILGTIILEFRNFAGTLRYQTTKNIECVI